MTWSGESIITGLGVILTLGTQQWYMHKQNRKEIVKRDQRLGFILDEHPPHSHGEIGDTPLKPTGIKYPKVKLNGA